MTEVPQGATPLGSTMYLFKSKTNSTDCIISAHGGYMSANRSFEIKDDIEILFYGPHGSSLIDPGIDNFMRRQGDAIVHTEAEAFTKGKSCRNYLLSKYQGAHAGASGKETLETYGQLKNTVATRDKARQGHFNTMMKGASLDQPDAKRVELAMEQIKKAQGGSILTIRNRWNVIMGIPLAEAIAAARKEMPTLRIFHALFCRSYMLGEDPLGSTEMRYRA